MPPLVFPYSLHRGKNVPILPIGLKTQDTPWWKINAYLDTGAFYSIFDDHVARLLCLSLMQGKKMNAVVGDGDQIPFFLHLVSLQVGGKNFEMEIGFSEKLKVGFNILGLDFLDYYEATFNNEKRIFILKPFKN